jgi:hypothetical protein
LQHSPFFNGKFACLVCDKEYKNETKRYFHLVERHGFPKEWNSKSLRVPDRIRPKKGAYGSQENKAKLELDKKHKMCRYVKAGEACPHGEECWFAHSKAELVPKQVSFGRRRPGVLKHDSKIDSKNDSKNDAMDVSE